MPDRWGTSVIVCKGGLDLFNDRLTKGTQLLGVADQLQNFEPALEGGYQRITGYQKWDDAVVPGDTDEPVLGVRVAFDGVLAVRKDAGGDNALYYSSGSGWGSKLNSAARSGAVTKARFCSTEDAIILTDGINPALKYDGSSDTLINGTGAPADPKYGASHLNRLVLAGYSAKPYAISLSAPNTDTDFVGANGAIEINVGDDIVGLASHRDALYVFCENSIHKLVGNTTSNFQIQEVTGSIGCLSHDSIQEVGGDLIFLAPDGFRSIAATERIGDIELGLLSKLIQPLVRPLIGTLGEDDVCSCVIRAKSQYRLLMQRTGLDDADQEGFIGKLEGRSNEGIAYSWSTLLGISAYCADSAYRNDDETIVFGHPTNGLVYRMERGNDFDGTPIQHIYQTPEFFFDDPERRKILFKVKAFTNSSGDIETNLSLDYSKNCPTNRNPAAVVFSAETGGAKYGSAVYDTDVFAGLSSPVICKNVTGSGESVSLKFAGNDSNEPFRIDSLIIEYSIKGRR